MELTSITLRNFRNHRNASFNFTDGITAIIGGNGSGKSRVVEAIVFLLTGEGYGKTKADMLTVGETSGWVVGKLLIDGKEAVLERHIDTAKVHFMYDGKTYKKSGEVAEIWNSLFQIDKNIVQNVIVSNQGEISLLFNGDNATREKLFQKIFMVPNTTKLRDVVWNYIKEAPPEYPVKDLVELESEIQCVEKTISLGEEELAKLFFNQETYDKLVTRRAFLAKVAESRIKHQELSAQLEQALEHHRSVGKSCDNIREKQASINIQDYRQALAEQEANQKLYNNQQKLVKERESLTPPTVLLDREHLQQLALLETSIEAELKVKRAKVAELNQKIAEYEKSGLSTGVCPTCGTQVDDVVKLIAHVKQEREPYLQSGVEQKTRLTEIQAELATLRRLEQSWDTYEKKLVTLDQALANYTNIEYNPEHLELYRNVILKYDERDAQLSKLSKDEREADTLVHNYRVQIAALAVYDKDDSLLEQEQTDIAAAISEAQKTALAHKNLEIEIASGKRELIALKRDLADNQSYIAKNKQRGEYVAILRGVYDLFHTGKFPRALIQTYSSTVSEYMTEVLNSFDFPYTAKVNETFGIDVFDTEGHLLPSISGGQEVMVGFSLRLALHNMFVGAFPLMIVDEGSYGLTDENAKKYFEIIKKLGKTSKFKQMIVIDHHNELSEYVDNTIVL